MKFLSVKWGVILIGLIVFSYAEVRGEDWKSLNTTESGVNYYSPESITRLPKNIVRVWMKTELSEKGLKDMEATLGKHRGKLSYILFLNEIDCGERASRLLSVVLYSEDGLVIGRVDWSILRDHGSSLRADIQGGRLEKIRQAGTFLKAPNFDCYGS